MIDTAILKWERLWVYLNWIFSFVQIKCDILFSIKKDRFVLKYLRMRQQNSSLDSGKISRLTMHSLSFPTALLRCRNKYILDNWGADYMGKFQHGLSFSPWLGWKKTRLHGKFQPSLTLNLRAGTWGKRAGIIFIVVRRGSTNAFTNFQPGLKIFSDC